MGTTQQTQQSNQFDPTAMSTYKGLQGPLGAMTTGYMSDPFGNPFFRMQQLMGNRQAQQLGGTQTSNILRNLTASGMFGGGSSSPFAMEMLQNQNRANTGLTSSLGFLAPVQNALGMQQWAGNLASNYRPLQTGQHQTQSTSGLGTWLPQVAGMGMGLLGAGLGGGSFMGLPNSANSALSSGPGMMSGVPSYGSWSGLSGANPMFGGSPSGGGGGAPAPSPSGAGGNWFPGL